MNFLRFYMDFKKISKVTLLFEMRFCRQAPGKVFLLQIGPYIARNTLETVGALQCGPWGGWRARLAGIPAVLWAWPTGDRRRAARGSPRLDSRAHSGGVGDGGPARQSQARRPRRLERRRRRGQRWANATARAPAGPRGGFRVVVWRRARARGPLGQAVDRAPAAERLRSEESACAREVAGVPFNRRSSLW
jgi:hypothetical protein